MRKIRRWSRLIILFILAFLTLSFVSSQFYEYDFTQTTQHSKPETQHLDSLRLAFGNNKIIPQSIENECLMALSHYPELANAHIIFSYAPIKYTMQTQPHWTDFFRKKADRIYTITINNDAKRYTGLDYNELSTTAKIGWVGHELGHICDFEQMNVPQIVGFGIRYGTSSRFRRTVEYRVDKITIQHGLGEELYEGADYLLNKSKATEAYKNTQKNEYMPLDIIKAEILKR